MEVGMQVTIKKWGNSLAARIPKAVAESVDLHMDQLVNIDSVDGKIIITPIETEKKYRLDDLLDQCKPEAMKMDAEDLEWLDDEPVGREAW